MEKRNFASDNFAIQTYRQEVADYFNQLDEDNRRLVIRGDIKQWNQMLAISPMQPKVYIKKHRVGGMFSPGALQWWQRSIRN